jgi:ribokinase
VITVLGSINLDYVVRVDRHPVPGETILGSDVETHPGGKGANQAVAAARSGARVRMVGCLGSDVPGAFMRDNLEREGIDTTLVKNLPGASGAAFIAVNKAGQNSIIVSPGTNALVTVDDLTPSRLAWSKILLMQLETPLETVLHVAHLAQRGGVKVVLNLAPAQALSAAQLGNVDVLVVNELEAGTLGGRTPTTPTEALEVARGLRRLVKTVIVTVGAQGAVCSNADFEGHLRSPQVNVVDTTAAGDAFIGALCASLSENSRLEEALRRGVVAGALACTKHGAQPSLPKRAEIEALVAAERYR